MQALTFHVYMERPDTHIFRIRMQIPALSQDVLTLTLPVWTPGSYLVREYARHINALHAFTDAGPLPVEKYSKNEWQLHTAGNACTVEYTLYAFEESVRTCWLDDAHATLIPAGMFLHIAGHDMPVLLHMHPAPAFTRISTALPMFGDDPFTRYAADLETLYDSPIEIGNQQEFTFNAAGIDHTLAIFGTGNYQPEKMIADFQRIIDTEVRIFGHHPCPAYTILLNTSNTLRGGLEHKDSTSLIYKRLMFEPRENYLDFLSLFAHEYFHLWNVKRLRPKALGPFNYTEENYTTGLWIAEGFTSYYDDLIVYRAGLYTEQEYLKVVEKNINQSENAPGKHIQSVADASFDAWIKYYRQNENSENSQVNYYVRGSVLAMLLDIQIIHHSGARYCLDDVMREAYHHFYLNRSTGFTESEFKAVLEQFAGLSLDHFYANHVFGTRQLELHAYAELVGLQLQDSLQGTIETDLGITNNEKNVITAIRRDSAAERGGLYVQDELVAIDGYRYQSGLIPSLIIGKQAGDSMQFTVARAGCMLDRKITLQVTDKVQYTLKPVADPTPEQQRNYAKWMWRMEGLEL